MGYNDKEFLDAYYANIDLQTEEVLESSPVAIALIDYMNLLKEATSSWTTAAALSLRASARVLFPFRHFLELR